MAKSKSTKKDNPTTGTTELKKTGEFGQSEAAELAASYLPNDGKFDAAHKVIWVTSDKSVFYAHNHGAARTHADRNNLKLFKVKN